jgi:hypothetical protein
MDNLSAHINTEYVVHPATWIFEPITLYTCEIVIRLFIKINTPPMVLWIIKGQGSPLSVGHAIIRKAMRDMTHIVRKSRLR